MIDVMVKAVLVVASIAAVLAITVVSEAKRRPEQVEQESELLEDERTSDQ